MDAVAQLALLTKAKLVFEAEQTFLSFPVLEPLTYPPERLEFVRVDGSDPIQRLTDLAEFSRVTNRIPRDVIAPQDDEYVWDVYDDVLRSAEVASGSMTSDERARLDDALALLYTPTADGGRQDSAALSSYKAYRDTHIKALEEYKNRQLTAETSNDPVLTAQWVIDEPAIREGIAQILNEWEVAGGKAAIERAQQIEETFAARAPVLQWDDWKDSFDRTLDLQTDLNKIEFAPTIFSPYDVFDHGAWLRFTLTNAEIMHLVQQAPPELTSILGAGGGSAIESISFEYRSVSLARSWLRPALFRARFWRLAADSEPLSDGGVPPKGRLPSYPVGLVFARNIVVQWRERPVDAAPIDGPQQLITVSAPSLTQIVAARRIRLRLTEQDQKVPHAEPTPAVIRIPRHVLAGRAPLGSRIRAEPTDFAAGGLAPRALGTAFATHNSSGIRILLREIELERRAQQAAAAAAAAAAETEAPVTANVTILAFICKRLPRCPDPDPGLSW